MRPLVVAGLKADIVGVFAREAADEGHADVAIDVLGARVKELAVPEDGIAGLADKFTPLGKVPSANTSLETPPCTDSNECVLKYSYATLWLPGQ